jgi:S-DNA-T family DNA segregation ATPase FtsK/SpoIIIE
MAKPASRRSRGSARADARDQESLFAPTHHWWDGEALGLILLGVGVVLCLTMFAPPQYAGILGGLRRSLQGWIGWSAFLLPALPISFGFLLVLRRAVQPAVRVAVGLLVVVVASLAASAIARPDLGGSVGVTLARPFKPLGPLAYVLAALIGSLGVELAMGWTPTMIARNIVRVIALTLAWIALISRNLFGVARDNAARLATISRLRTLLINHIRDIEGLERLYPGTHELKSWKVDAHNTLTNLSALDDKGFTLVEKDLAGWSKLVAQFTTTRAKELQAQIGTEDAGALPVIEEARRVLGKNLSGQGMPTKVLENIRRALLLDADTLLETTKRLKRDRDAAQRVLGAGIRPLELASELERHKSRSEGSRVLLDRAEALMERVKAFPGWPDFVARLEKPSHPEVQKFTDVLVQTLRTARADALPDLPDWTRDLDALETRIEQERIAQQQSEAESTAALEVASTMNAPSQTASVSDVLSGTVFSAQVPMLASNASVSADNTGVYEAVFELDFPNGPHVSAEDIAALTVDTKMNTHPGSLEVLDLDLNGFEPVDADDAPWVSPTERAATKVNAVRANSDNLQPKPDAKGIADSGVGERLKAPSVPPVGAIPIQVPGMGFLDPVQVATFDVAAFDRDARMRAATIDEAFSNFGIQARVLDFARGPTVTRYEVEPAPGEKISRIQSIQNDLARVLKVGGVRIEAPVPGKSVVGLEVPNAEREPITFRTGIESRAFASHKAKLPLLLGKSIDGEMVVGDLGRMPHLLIAGSTGSGKSVCVNTLIMSLLFRYLPTELRFVMVDPKMVELTPYDGIPHLVRPVVTNPMDAAGVLLGCVAHMERRYKMMSDIGAKNLEQYNEKARASGEPELPYLVIIIDELADLMITSPKEVEAAIMRLAQMARATGMHLILATQRPSADVVTGLIKVNVPSRIAFAVSSGIDSRTILDSTGAERLTGYGDMLFYQPGLVKPVRLQGPYLSENELARVTEFLRRQFFEDDFGEAYGTDFDGVLEQASGTVKAEDIDFGDPFIKKAAEVVVEEGYAAVSRLQRRLSVGHARAGKLIDALEAMGIVGPYKGSKSREVLVGRDQLPDFFG